jgi:hypothetical protein
MKKKMNNSAAKKLVPAAGMLGVSAMMLATSTYAWFTMAREVEVQNIQMTATVPANLQISAGMLNTTVGSGDGYNNNKGILVKDASATNADNGNVAAPGDAAEYWSNSIDLSNYYVMGKIMPASSTNGQAIFFTPDAAGVGKTLTTGAKFYKAVDNAAVQAESTIRTGSEKTTLASTLHAFTGENGTGDTWLGDGLNTGTYRKSVEWNDTKDDGYYVDIPLWIRSSSTDQDIVLAVDAYVTSSSKKDEDDLYKAARAVILGANKSTTSGLLEIRPDSLMNGDSPNNETIVDFMYTTNASGEAVSQVSDENLPTYATVAHYNGSLLGGDGTSNILKIAKASADGKYGTPTKFWVRVWLEGEDPNCWNDNAGQDFRINLKFTREAMSAAATPQTYPTAVNFESGANYDANGGLNAGKHLEFNVNGKKLVYEYRETTKWNRLTVSFPEAPLGTTYKIQLGDGTQTAVANEAALVTWLNANVTTAANVNTGVIVTKADLAVADLKQFNATVTSGTVAYSIATGGSGFTTDFAGKKFRFNGVDYETYVDLNTALAKLPNGTYTIDVVAATP